MIEERSHSCVVRRNTEGSFNGGSCAIASAGSSTLFRVQFPFIVDESRAVCVDKCSDARISCKKKVLLDLAAGLHVYSSIRKQVASRLGTSVAS